MPEILTLYLKNNNGDTVSFEIPKFDYPYKFYWEKSLKIELEILQKIVDISINKPYPLEPNTYLSTKLHGEPFKIYRQNHDSTHGLRQYFYIDYLLTSLKKSATSEWVNIIDSLTTAEIAILKLSAFCLRIGRLNEANKKQGSLHEIHSSELFESIAAQLGFNENLIKNTKNAMIKSKADEMINNDISVTHIFYKFLDMAHRADLVRCWNSKEDKKFPSIYNKLVSEFLFFVNDLSSSEKRSIELMDYAAKACIMTGNKVKLFSPQHSIEYNYPYVKRKKAKCTNIEYGVKQLNKIS